MVQLVGKSKFYDETVAADEVESKKNQADFDPGIDDELDLGRLDGNAHASAKDGTRVMLFSRFTCSWQSNR